MTNASYHCLTFKLMKKINIKKYILAMSKQLKPLTEQQKEYARSILPNIGYYKRSGEIWCQCCGRIGYQVPGILEIDLECGYTCECGNNLKLVHARRLTKMADNSYFTVVQTHKGYQVLRTFHVIRMNLKGDPSRYEIHEVYQNWISPEGIEIILGKSYSRSPFYFRWNYDSKFSIRQHNSSYTGQYAFNDVFDVSRNYFYPKFNITRKLRKYGWCKGVEKLQKFISVADCMKLLLSSNHAETVVKQKQYEVFLYMVRNGIVELQYMPQMNICHRNKYVITDASMYFDTIRMLEHMDKDIRNPKYICPEDIYKAHNDVLAAYTRMQRKIQEEEKIRRATYDNGQYVKDKQKFFGIVIVDKELSIEVLKSIQEFIEEGEAMHHCVFANEYYKNKDSLILSAKLNGERKETIEVNLKTFSVVQSRAAFNKISKYHNRILNLINRNMNLIRQCV